MNDDDEGAPTRPWTAVLDTLAGVAEMAVQMATTIGLAPKAVPILVPVPAERPALAGNRYRGEPAQYGRSGQAHGQPRGHLHGHATFDAAMARELRRP